MLHCFCGHQSVPGKAFETNARVKRRKNNTHGINSLGWNEQRTFLSAAHFVIFGSFSNWSRILRLDRLIAMRTLSGVIPSSSAISLDVLCNI